MKTKHFYSVADAHRWLSRNPDKVDVKVVVASPDTIRRIIWTMFAAGLLLGAISASALDLILDPPVWSITIRY